MQSSKGTLFIKGMRVTIKKHLDNQLPAVTWF